MKRSGDVSAALQTQDRCPNGIGASQKRRLCRNV